MFWISLAISSYFFSALSQTFDKILLKSRIPSPATYAFYTGLTSALVIVLLPFVGALSNLALQITVIVMALAAGVIFIPAIYFLFIALSRCDISRIVPIIGGSIPIFLLLIGLTAGIEQISKQDFLGIALFVAGGFILATEIMSNERLDSFATHIFGIRGKRLQICGIESRWGIGAALFSGFFFALTYYTSKIVYAAPSDFIPEFIWMRLGSVVGALIMLLIPMFRMQIFTMTPTISRSSAEFLFANKLIGASSFLLLNASFNAAANQSQIVIINALKGIEHLFIFILSFALTLWRPNILMEPFDYHTIVLKLIGIIAIAFGFIAILG